MTSHDIETLKECAMILCRISDQLIKQAKHCQDDKVKFCINEVATEINNQAHNLRKNYEFPKEKMNHDHA